MSDQPEAPNWLVWLAGALTALVMGFCAQPTGKSGLLVDAPAVLRAPGASIQESEQTPPPAPARADIQDGSGGDRVAEEDAPEWLTWPEARAEQAEAGRPVLVFLSFGDRAADAACLPCQRLKKTLADPDTLARVAELGILARGVCEDWQGDKLRAPAIVYVTGDDDTPPMLSRFAVGPPDKFLEQLKAWIDAQ